MDVLTIVCLIFLMSALPVFGQWNSWQIFDSRFFKKIRISRFKFLFRTNYSESIEKDGIVIPMFIYQVLGYLLSTISIIITLFLFKKIGLCIKILTVIFLTEGVGFVITGLVLRLLSKKRKRQKEEISLKKRDKHR